MHSRGSSNSLEDGMVHDAKETHGEVTYVAARALNSDFHKPQHCSQNWAGETFILSGEWANVFNMGNTEETLHAACKNTCKFEYQWTED